MIRDWVIIMNEGISLEVALEENGRKQSRIERYTYDIKGFFSD